MTVIAFSNQANNQVSNQARAIVSHTDGLA